MKEQVEAWWTQAKIDLQAAEVNFGAREYYVASWLAQQAVEKGLKARYMQRHGEYAPRTHQIVDLGSALDAPASVTDDLSIIDPAFEMSRYPDPIEGIPAHRVDARVAVAHLSAARRVMEWIERQLLQPRSS